jgi:hypothetical protein
MRKELVICMMLTASLFAACTGPSEPPQTSSEPPQRNSEPVPLAIQRIIRSPSMEGVVTFVRIHRQQSDDGVVRARLVHADEVTRTLDAGAYVAEIYLAGCTPACNIKWRHVDLLRPHCVTTFNLDAGESTARLSIVFDGMGFGLKEAGEACEINLVGT